LVEWPFLFKAFHQLSREVFGIGAASPVSANKQFASLIVTAYNHFRCFGYIVPEAGEGRVPAAKSAEVIVSIAHACV
jgi:hypothetical protein